MLDIRAGVEAYDKYEIAAFQEKELRKELLAILSAGGVLPPEKEKKWENAKWDKAERKREMDYKLNLALQTTSKAYGLGLGQSGIVNGPLKGYGMRWNPRFLYTTKDEQGSYKPVYLRQNFPDEPEKKPHYLGVDFDSQNPEEKVQAVTLENGDVFVSIEAFILALETGSPRLLAKTLYHEGVHIRQLATDGWENASRQEMEAKACIDTFENLDTFELTLDETGNVELGKQQALWDYNEFRADRQTKILPFSTDSQRIGFEEKYRDANTVWQMEEQQRATLEEGFAAARQAIENNRRQRQEAEERRQQEAKKVQDEISRKGWEKVYSIRWELLKALTLDACKDSSSFKKYYKNTVSPETRIPENLLLQKLRKPEKGPSLTPCQQETIAFMVHSDGPVLLEQVADVAKKALDLFDPLKAVTGFFRSIQDKLKSTPGPSGPGGSDPDERHGGGNQDGSAPGNLNGPAYGQLKGIAGGRSWPQ